MTDFVCGIGWIEVYDKTALQDKLILETAELLHVQLKQLGALVNDVFSTFNVEEIIKDVSNPESSQLCEALVAIIPLFHTLSNELFILRNWCRENQYHADSC